MFNKKEILDLKKEILDLKNENIKLRKNLRDIKSCTINIDKEKNLKILFKEHYQHCANLRYLNNTFTLYHKSKSQYLACFLLKLSQDLKNGHNGLTA